jgi:hypothetical protein
MKSSLSGSSGTSKMKLTAKEQKVARLAFDKAAQPGERQAAAAKLIESLSLRGVSVEDIEKESVRIEYRERMQTQTVPRRNRPAGAAQQKTPTKCHDEPHTMGKPERSHMWTRTLGVAAAFAILLTSIHSNSALSPATQLTLAAGPTLMTAEQQKQRETRWEQFKEADRKERELLQKQEAERKAQYEAEPEPDSIIGATPAPQ